MRNTWFPLMCRLSVVTGLALMVVTSTTMAIVVEVSSSNVEILEDLASLGLNPEDPAPGYRYGNIEVVQFRDSDNGSGPDWIGVGFIQGSTDQAWLRDATASMSTTTTVPSDVVTFHLEGDNNDGRVSLKVDGSEVARLDMWDAGNNRLLVIVRYLPMTTHTLVIDDLGTTLQGGASGDDIAAFGGAAAKEISEPIPTLSTWGLLALGLSLLAGGMFLIQRRHTGGQAGLPA